MKKRKPRFTPEEREAFETLFAKLWVDDFYRETGRAEKIKSGVDAVMDCYFLPAGLVGVKKELLV